MASEHQTKVRQAMEGNIAAYFHPQENRIAFLYPNGVINLYDSETWDQYATKTVGTTWGDGSDKSREEIVGSADMSMVREGFDREGRMKEVIR